MKRITIITVLCAALAAMAALAMAADGQCPLCGMSMAGNENTAYEITFKDGKVVTYCCPHCGIWEQSVSKDKVASARARDFISGEWMDAAKMFYVYKSSAVPACAPSWIAFGKQAEAEKFMKGFGGTLYPFDKALAERAKHPKAMEMMQK